MTLENQCFGSAGALVTVEPNLFYDGPAIRGRATIVYEISGGEYGTETYSLEVDGTEYTFNRHTIATANCSQGLAARVVNVIER